MLGLPTRKASAKTDYQEGVVSDTIYPGKRWRVRFEATEWFAHSHYSANLKTGDFVRVVGKVNTTTLLIEPVI